MSQALEGIRVIDFTHDQAGPSCTQMLAWLGADVIKIERPPHGDRARRLWNSDNPNLDSFFFLLLNSNKRSTVINLRAEEGKEIARRLIKTPTSSPRTLDPASWSDWASARGGQGAQPARRSTLRSRVSAHMALTAASNVSSRWRKRPRGR